MFLVFKSNMNYSKFKYICFIILHLLNRNVFYKWIIYWKNFEGYEVFLTPQVSNMYVGPLYERII